MTIKEIRTATGMTQQAFCDLLGIPKRTLEDWEQNKRNPPDYVVSLIQFKVSKILKINF